MSLQVDTGRDALMAAMRLVHDARIDVEDVALRQPNLDEVFLALTGRQAAAGTPTAKAA
ncbi:MAG TPA: hypothetical protein VHJ39_17265 [Solirubrobacteraceae bacterium]|nr:hypothetical protein [Solirubrobacteraceae bacterium]